ncbi:AmmeMemoRadiSam system protein A [Dissulfurirhabdus thermomarina]|uniref:AmmeMemoRadiSam system protein A n=1 Tax=Dissulfurirhabdus thermomarina TaxID=1765737 RepID=A0A6N9TU54_DISTH|nr:AmmeMemoRadiSam system protein A [Dissulfurirhabdus thermomarina]NDY42026.1 AmmeMemoRadiSam system protein A [Dissulfurirhabdus thermomarina]NMX23051.1 AmmeMemoRadiSam system protein A [Dissulfurirhabdus thermomarina]
MSSEPLTPPERAELLRIAREAIAARFSGKKISLSFRKTPGLEQPRGAFVTLHRDGALRGCIGCFTTPRPLYETVAEMAISAAFKDPRFPPLQEAELAEVEIEISALTPLRRITDVEEIQVGTHGIYLSNGPFHGVLLPQVAVEYGWDRETFLDQTCRKAGLPPGCWRDPATEIHVFSAEIFSERTEGLVP